MGARQGEGCVLGELADETDDADEIAFAAEDAVGAQENRHKSAVGGAQRGGFDKCGAAGSAIEEPRLEAVGGFAGRQTPTEACDGICLSSRGVVAQQAAPSFGEPVALVGEIELERAERSVGAPEALEPSVVGQTGLLKFAAFGDVEAETGHAFEFAGLADLLEAGALQPNVISATVLHAELDVDAPDAGRVFASREKRSRIGILGVDGFAPRFLMVGQFGIDVTQKFFPSSRIEDTTGLEIQVEETGDVVLKQQAEPVVASGRVGRGDRGILDDRDVAGSSAQCGLQPHELVEGGSLAGLDAKDSAAVKRGGERDFPLGFEQVGTLGYDFDVEE